MTLADALPWATTRRVPFVQQLTDTECGAACLMMVLAYHGYHAHREEVRDSLGSGRDGLTARDIVEAARRFGLRARGVQVNLDRLATVPRGAVLHWRGSHFVVLDAVHSRGIDILDPVAGRSHVPMAEVQAWWAGVALLFEPGSDFALARSRRPGQVAFVASLLRGVGRWPWIFAVSAALQVLMLALPLLTGALVDRVLPQGDRPLLAILAAGLGVAVVFHLLASFLRSHLLLELRTRFDLRLTLGTLGHMLRLPYRFFQDRGAGDLMMRLNSSTHIREVLTSAVLSTALDGVMMVAYLAILAGVSPTMGAIVVVLGSLQLVLHLATRRRRYELSSVLLARQSAAQSYQMEMLSGMETLRSMGAEHRAEALCTGLLTEVVQASLAEGRLGAVVDAATTTLRMGTPLAVLLAGAHLVLSGGLSVGTMLALEALAVGTLAPLSGLVATAGQLQSLSVHLERLQEVRETPVEQHGHQVRPAPQLQGRIELEHVDLRYGRAAPKVLDDVSLTIEPGEFVAIVGRSGSGKSSLVSLILGLHAPTAGRVRYDGLDLGGLDHPSVRRQLGVVSQRAQLFAGSLRANIALGGPDASMDEIVLAAMTAQLHEDIAQMPMGYETLVTAGGGSLSGGQRQRVALARALLARPRILVLDEATSALDAVTEHRVQEAIAGLSCTRVVIAHRLSTVVRADKIVVLEAGRVVEVGRHADLMRMGGVYAALVEAQLG